jgi:hypothetical protein
MINGLGDVFVIFNLEMFNFFLINDYFYISEKNYFNISINLTLSENNDNDDYTIIKIPIQISEGMNVVKQLSMK